MIRPAFTPLLVAGLLALTGGTAVAAPGFGGWRFGMSAQDVKAVKRCKGYAPVATTGGLECKGFAFLGQKLTVSFVFAAGKLAKIQVWVYEGTSEGMAAKQLKRLFDHLKKTAGPIESPSLKDPGTMSEAQLLGEIRKQGDRGQPGEAAIQAPQEPRRPLHLRIDDRERHGTLRLPLLPAAALRIAVSRLSMASLPGDSLSR